MLQSHQPHELLKEAIHQTFGIICLFMCHKQTPTVTQQWAVEPQNQRLGLTQTSCLPLS